MFPRQHFMSFVTEYDSYLFHEGTNYMAYQKLGAHVRENGTHFALWAPNARRVALLSERTGWLGGKTMQCAQPGIWETFVEGMGQGEIYRYEVQGADGITRYKSDPYAFYSEKRPANASVVWPLSGYEWQDKAYQSERSADKVLDQPMAVYEVYLGSWKKKDGTPEREDGFLNYREYANQLAEYVLYMGYTHVELMGICEFPYDGSWGYQVTGFFSPTSRYGTPDDFRYFVDVMHQNGIGVILDWVPAHFPKDAFGLESLDGTALYEPSDPLRAEYPEWGTKAFDHGKPEVRSFLISSAYYWIHEFHVDALRVDAVAAMLYTSFSRTHWRPNMYGGNENLESIAFIRQLNETIRAYTTGYLIAEDSSILPGMTRPVEEDGYGFLLKWNMGWMNDTLRYITKDPIYRRWHHRNLTHSPEYAFTENFVLVLSHDEVVHGKASMLGKNPGNAMDQYGGLKTLYTYWITHPGKKLLFMGQDFAMSREWDEGRQIDWFLADDPDHRQIMNTVRELLAIYRKYPVLHSDHEDPTTFEWINSGDSNRNIISFLRRNPWNYNSALLVISNFSPSWQSNYVCGVPIPGNYKQIFSTYDALPGHAEADENHPVREAIHPTHQTDGRNYSLSYSLRPFESVIFEVPQDPEEEKKGGPDANEATNSSLK